MEQSIFQKQVMQRYLLPDIYRFNEFLGDDACISGSHDLIAILARCFEDENAFRSSDFNDLPMHILLEYISRTHRLYLDKSLQEIEQTICLLHEAYDEGHPVLELLNNFYLEYKTGLIIHIRQEDDKLLPYIQFLENALKGSFNSYEYFTRRQQFSIKPFFENHGENDAALDEVRSKILGYDPPGMNRFLYGVLLQQLEFFSQDLRIHGLIEDRVVIPRALEMEQRIEKIFSKQARLN